MKAQAKLAVNPDLLSTHLGLLKMKIRTSLASTANEIRGLSPGRGRMSQVILELARAIPKGSLHWGKTLSPSTWGCVRMEPPQLGMLREDPASGKKKEVIIVPLTDSLLVSQNRGVGPIATFHRWRKGGSERGAGR